LDRFGIDFAFLLEDARGERVGGVVVQHGDGPLQDDRAVVVVIVGEMDRTAADLGAVLQNGFVDAVTVVALSAKSGISAGWMFITRFSKSGGISTCLRNPPITTSCTPASRQGWNMASR
jgi:hypothetical protein